MPACQLHKNVVETGRVHLGGGEPKYGLLASARQDTSACFNGIYFADHGPSFWINQKKALGLESDAPEVESFWNDQADNLFALPLYVYFLFCF